MSIAAKFEDRVSSSPSTHEGEASESLCDRLSRTRDTSQRQLSTDQDYAVSTREYLSRIIIECLLTNQVGPL
jgi:hypothetical protein